MWPGDQQGSRCVCLLSVGCLTSQQHASVSQERIYSDNCTCCHTEIEAAHQTFYLIQSQYTDTGPTSPCADPKTPGAWQGSHWSDNFQVTGMTRPGKIPGFELRTFHFQGGRLNHLASEAVGSRYDSVHQPTSMTRPGESRERPSDRPLPRRTSYPHRLVGLVVKASASRAEDPGSNPA